MAAPRRTLLAATVAAIAVAALVVGRSVAQNRLLYFPEKATLDEVSGDGLSAWPGQADFRGLEAEPRGPARAVAVVFHGNAGHAGYRRYYASALCPLGVRVILAEYPGYGPRGGEMGEESFAADAESTVDLVRARHREPILVVGESLGAAVAARVAARRRDVVSALWLLTPWDRLLSISRYHYPWLPAAWFLRDRYDTVAHLASFDRPVLVDVAERDGILPPVFGRKLFDSLRSPKRLRIIRAAGHNDWSERVDAAWWREGVQYLLGGGQGSAPPR